jgi:hypothetical protein
LGTAGTAFDHNTNLCLFERIIAVSLILKRNGDFNPAPEGLHRAVCVDVIDLGVRDSQWGPKHQIVLVWEIDALRDDGAPHQVRAIFSASLHEKSKLYGVLKSWRGRAFTPQELAGFDMEKVIGAPCRVVISHTVGKDGCIYPAVVSVMPAERGLELTPSGHYIRKQKPQANGLYDGPAEAEEPPPF